MNLLTNNTATYKGVRTSLQAFIAFVVGLILVIWNTPGVPQNVEAYLRPYEVNVLVWIGIPTVFVSGLIAYVGGKIAEKQTPVVTPPTEMVAETGTPSETPQA